MRKRLITPIPLFRLLDEGWLDLDGAAVVEVTSEQKDHPIESALVLGQTRWRDANSGTQAYSFLRKDAENKNSLCSIKFAMCAIVQRALYLLFCVLA